ncbi:MAG TPA: urease accessory protein UreD [Kiritimatiellia bacterium]|nr:urease accessory protein UreD [Kiritimatiellia bacterium]
MQGTFDITCQRREHGETYIARQYVSSPWHLSKPYWDGQILLVQAANATAGIFSGDHLSLRVDVREHAAVLLTSPSASRIHTMHKGEATLRQSISVSANAWLEWMPELFIPQNKSSYRQITQVDVEKGGMLYMVETLAPGRVAHGESFKFERVEWTTRINHAGRMVLSERYPLSPGNGSLIDLTYKGKSRYFANALIIYPGADNLREWQDRLAEIAGPQDIMGLTEIDEDVYLIRLISEQSQDVKDCLRKLRDMLAEKIPQLRQSARKL